MGKLLLGLVLFVSVFFPLKAYSLDVLKPHVSASSKDGRGDYYNELYIVIMEATKDDFGEYLVEVTPLEFSQQRAILEVVSGEKVNVTSQVARLDWEKKTIPIRIPISKGLLSYRLFFIHKDDLDYFSRVKDLEELKKTKMGLQAQWSITRALELQGFNIVDGTVYEGMFGMLNRGRFKFFPRGLNEIYSELNEWKLLYPDMMIEPTLSLFVPLPTFIFVSPAYPRLAERLEVGLKRIIKNGEFDKLFETHYGQAFSKAKFEKRIIFYASNPLLTPETLKAVQTYKKIMSWDKMKL